MLGVDWGICTPLPGSATPQRLHRVSRKAEEKGQLAGPGNCEASRAHLSGHHMERGGTGKMFLESFIGASAGYGWEL